jgi:hypothetical protein
MKHRPYIGNTMIYEQNLQYIYSGLRSAFQMAMLCVSYSFQ